MPKDGINLNKDLNKELKYFTDNIQVTEKSCVLQPRNTCYL